MFEKLKIKIQEYKLLRIVIVAGFVSVALFLLHAKPVSAAKVCDQATSNYCIEIIKIEPNSPEQSKDFTVSAALSTQNVTQSLRGKPINFAVRWKVNPSDIADFRDSLTNEVKISLTPDSSGNSSQNLTQVFNINKTGPSVIGIKLEVLNGTTSMGPQAFDSRQITVNPRAASNTDSVEISNVVSPSSSDTTGRLINFSANYFPAGASSPVTSGDFIIKWDFGDGTTTVGSTVSHLYDKAGTYNVTVKVQKNGQVIAQNSKSITVNGNPTEPGDMGNPVMTLINQIIGVLLGFFQELIYQVFFYLIAPLIQAVLSIQVYTDTFAAVIYPGWEVVRNICNIFFVVALIVIALATLFRVDSYQFRSLLVQLILAALLVNFSLVIAQAILGLADTIQAQFLPSNVEVIRSLAKDLMVKTYRDVYFTNAFSEGSFSGIVKPLFFLALAMGSFAVFAAIAVFLVIRIVALWVLLLISPMAYAVGVLPSTAGYRKQWWDMFLKYAFFTPIMAFFLNLTAVIANTYNTNPILQQINSPELQAQLGGSTIATFVFKVASNILLLVFLMAALKVADMAGIYGASAITSVAQKGILAPFAAAGGGLKMAGGYFGRKYSDWTVNKIRGHEPKVSLGRSVLFAVSNPKAAIAGFQKRSEELSHASKAKAEAAGLEVVEQRLTGGKKVIPRVLNVEKSEEDEFVKVFSHLNREGVVKTALDIFQMKDNDEGKAMKRGIIKLAMDKGYIDDIVQSGADDSTPEGAAFVKKLYEAGIVDKNASNWRKDWDEIDGKKVLKHDDRQRRAMYKAFFGEHGHVHDQAALRLITEEGEDSGKKTGHFEYLKDGEKDIQTGMYRLREDEEYKYDQQGNLQFDENDDPILLKDTEKQRKGAEDSEKGRAFAAGEVAKMGDRAQAAAAYHSFITLAKHGKIVDKRFIKAVARAITGNPGFMQQRTSPNVIFGKGVLDDEQKKHFDETGKILVDIDTFRAMQQIANVEGGGGVLASMYSMGVFDKKDDNVIKSINSKAQIPFDIRDDSGNIVGEKVIKWKKSQDELKKEMTDKLQKETESENEKQKKSSEEEYRKKSLELLDAIAKKLK